VIEVVKGGLIALIHNCRVFVPSSQAASRFVEDLSVFKGKEFNFQILEFDRSKPRYRILAGRRELAAKEQKQRRDELLASLEIGQQVAGVVSRVVDYGAFIDLGGADGLVHISQLSWQRVRRVSDVIKEGDHVTVTVLDIDPEKGKVSLSLKDINDNPWHRIAEKYPIGSVVEGRVARLAPFGAFVNLEEGVDGLVHISQIADRHLTKPDEALSIGDVIWVKVIDVDEAGNRISLSKREADADQYEPYNDESYDDEPYENDVELSENGAPPFGDTESATEGFVEENAENL